MSVDLRFNYYERQEYLLADETKKGPIFQFVLMLNSWRDRFATLLRRGTNKLVSIHYLQNLPSILVLDMYSQ